MRTVSHAPTEWYNEHESESGMFRLGIVLFRIVFAPVILVGYLPTILTSGGDNGPFEYEWHADKFPFKWMPHRWDIFSVATALCLPLFLTWPLWRPVIYIIKGKR